MKKTKTAFRSYKPVFNDTFYFPINVSKGSDEKERNKEILKELNVYGSINFNF